MNYFSLLFVLSETFDDLTKINSGALLLWPQVTLCFSLVIVLQNTTLYLLFICSSHLWDNKLRKYKEQLTHPGRSNWYIAGTTHISVGWMIHGYPGIWWTSGGQRENEILNLTSHRIYLLARDLDDPEEIVNKQMYEWMLYMVHNKLMKEKFHYTFITSLIVTSCGTSMCGQTYLALTGNATADRQVT